MCSVERDNLLQHTRKAGLESRSRSLDADTTEPAGINLNTENIPLNTENIPLRILSNRDLPGERRRQSTEYIGKEVYSSTFLKKYWYSDKNKEQIKREDKI